MLWDLAIYSATAAVSALVLYALVRLRMRKLSAAEQAQLWKKSAQDDASVAVVLTISSQS
jgi:hypothetical protein